MYGFKILLKPEHSFVWLSLFYWPIVSFLIIASSPAQDITLEKLQKLYLLLNLMLHLLQWLHWRKYFLLKALVALLAETETLGCIGCRNWEPANICSSQSSCSIASCTLAKCKHMRIVLKEGRFSYISQKRQGFNIYIQGSSSIQNIGGQVQVKAIPRLLCFRLFGSGRKWPI